MKIAGALAVAVFALAVLWANVLRHPQYTPDGIVYARFAARDAGRSERDATLQARAYYDRTAMMSNPRYRALIELDPSVSFARSKVFENRVLYPWTVSLLLPAAGFRALFLVSAISYVAFGLALYWLLVAVGRPWLAAILSIAALALPLTRAAAASDLTDMLAMLWWTLALGAILRGFRVRTGWNVALLALASALLALTRPTPYLVVLPAAAAAILQASWVPLLASLGGVVAFAGVAVSTHAYGIGEQLRWVYSHRPDNDTAVSFSTWYRNALFSTLRFTIAQTVRTVVPLLAIVGVIYGIVRTRMRDECIVLAVCIVACAIAIPFNPVPSAIARVVVLPLIPVFCAIAQCLAATPAAETLPAPNRRLSPHSVR